MDVSYVLTFNVLGNRRNGTSLHTELTRFLLLSKVTGYGLEELGSVSGRGRHYSISHDVQTSSATQ